MSFILQFFFFEILRDQGQEAQFDGGTTVVSSVSSVCAMPQSEVSSRSVPFYKSTERYAD